MTMPEIESVVINEVQFGSLDQVEIYNNGNVEFNLDDYWLCLGPGRYLRIGDSTPVSGSTLLPAGEFLVLQLEGALAMDNDEGLGMYSMRDFTNPDVMVDFVQWGAGGSARENIAEAAGIWVAGDFVSSVAESSSICLLYTSPSPRDQRGSRMPSSA